MGGWDPADDLDRRIAAMLHRREEVDDGSSLIQPSGWELAVAIERLRQRITRNVAEDLSTYSASFAQMRAVMVLHFSSGLIHAGELGRKMQISRQAAHTLLKRLTRLGLIEFVDEGWAKSATLTPNGQRCVRLFMDETRKTFGKLEQLPVPDRKKLRRILDDADRLLYRPRERDRWWED